jgi:hypothetical protein
VTVSGAPDTAPIEPPLCHPPPPATVGHPTALCSIEFISFRIAPCLAAFASFLLPLRHMHSVYLSRHCFLERRRTSSSPFPFTVSLIGALVSFPGCRVIWGLPFPGIAPSTPLFSPLQLRSRRQVVRNDWDLVLLLDLAWAIHFNLCRCYWITAAFSVQSLHPWRLVHEACQLFSNLHAASNIPYHNTFTLKSWGSSALLLW